MLALRSSKNCPSPPSQRQRRSPAPRLSVRAALVRRRTTSPPWSAFPNYAGAKKMPPYQPRQRQRQTTRALAAPRAHRPPKPRFNPSQHSSPSANSAENCHPFAASRICAPRPSAPVHRPRPLCHSHPRPLQQQRITRTTDSAPRRPLGHPYPPCIPHPHPWSRARCRNPACRSERTIDPSSADRATLTALRRLPHRGPRCHTF